jgi:hypothetical protein
VPLPDGLLDAITAHITRFTPGGHTSVDGARGKATTVALLLTTREKEALNTSYQRGPTTSWPGGPVVAPMAPVVAPVGFEPTLYGF